MTTSPFAALGARVHDGFKVKLIDPVTGLPIVSKDGQEAFIEVLSTDSEQARAFDRERQRAASRLISTGQQDTLIDEDGTIVAIKRTAVLTKSWHLVDPASGEPIDYPCTRENAEALYMAPETRWIYRLAVVGSANTANFMKRSSAS
jgi:hypothetical protein